MSKIIPWNLPEVAGGSVGGYTPEPTPPTPSNYPYDLDNLSLVTSFDSFGKIKNGLYYVFVRGKLAVSGVVILDSMNVGSVIASVTVGAGSITWSGATASFGINDDTIDVDISAYMSSDGGTAFVTNAEDSDLDINYLSSGFAYSSSNWPTYGGTAATLTVTSIKVYNTNGVVIQEWEPGE